MPFAERAYAALPTPIQDLAVSVAGWRSSRRRYSAPFRQRLAEYEERLSWSADQVAAFQRSRLLATLRLASTTPYYRRMFQGLGVTADEVVEKGLFSLLPITEKDAVRASPEDFVPAGFRGSARLVHTSGSTGSPVALRVTHDAMVEQWAVWWRCWRSHGLRRNMWRGFFGKAPIVVGDGRPWRTNYAGREIRFSIFHMSPELLPRYVEKLNRARPPWLHGFPSALALLATYIVNDRHPLRYSVSAVTTGGENLERWQAEVITQAFGVTPRQHYGLAEGVANLSECPNGHLHTDDDYSYVEFVDDPTSGAHQIIGTALTNAAMVLVRYRTGDLADARAGACGCGRWGRVVTSLDGRREDYIVLPGGTRVGRLASAVNGVPGVAALQIIQVEDGSLQLHYVRGSDWREGLEVELVRRLASRVNHAVEISAIEVPAVQRSPNGKVRTVISHCRAGDERTEMSDVR